MSLCRTELDKSKEERDIWTILIQALKALGRYDETLVELELARHFCPLPQFEAWTLEHYLQMGCIPQAREIFDGLKNTLDVASALRWGNQFLNAHDSKSAQVCLDYIELYVEQKLKSSSQQASANLVRPESMAGNIITQDSPWLYRGPWLSLKARCAEMRGDLIEATTFYKQALSLNPLDPYLLLHLGQLTSDKEPELAQSLFERGTRIESMAPQAFLYLGDLFAKQKKWPEALAYVRKSLQLQPSDSVQRYYESILKLSQPN